jgi:uncharacterized protein YbaA (DUF1428 family)
MPTYVDGFVLTVPKKKFPLYKKMAQLAAKVWIEHGAVSYRECIGEDLKVKFGLPFPKLTKAKPTETVCFSWIEYKSRAHRDKVNAKVMKDKRMLNACDPNNPPFDMKKMAYGGFEVFVAGGK